MISTVAIKTAGLTLLTFVANMASKVISGQKVDSLSSFTKTTRVEPIALVDKTLVHQSWMYDVMSVANSIFTGYYLQAVALSATAINGVSAMRVLDTLNPTRDVADAANTRIVDSLNGPSLLSFESYRYGLPVPGTAIGLEAFGDDVVDYMRDHNEKAQAEREADEAARSYSTSDTRKDAVNQWDNRETFKTGIGENRTLPSVSEAVNLSVGRLFEVNIQQGSNSFKIPVSIRLISTVVDANILAHILGDGGQNKSFKERYHAWRAGQLEFIRDIVFMQDLIDQHKQLLAKDETGTYAEIMKRRRNNGIAAGLSGSPSIGTASNIVVISKRTAQNVERMENGRFSDPKFRTRMFKNTYMLILFIIDEDVERVTIYHRDIALPTQLSIKELKVSSKGTGPDVMEIMKAYQMGSAARL